MEYERPTRQQRYEAASLYIALKCPLFNPPAISKAGADRLQKAMNNAPPLAMHESGDAVKAVQKALLELHDPAITIPDGATGYFGNQTDEAVRAFQRRYRLERRDGLVGNETLGRLDAEYFRKSLPPYEDDIHIWCPNAPIIPRLKQPWGPGTCWATAMAMMYYWKHPYELLNTPFPTDQKERDITKIRYVLQQARHSKPTWEQLFDANDGLPYRLNVSFFSNGYGLQHEGSSPNEDYGLDRWIRMLRRSPVLVAGGKNVYELQQNLHVFLVIGVRRTFTKRDEPTFHLIDPNTGIDQDLSLSQLMKWLGFLHDWTDVNGLWKIQDSVQFRERLFYY